MSCSVLQAELLQASLPNPPTCGVLHPAAVVSQALHVPSCVEVGQRVASNHVVRIHVEHFVAQLDHAHAPPVLLAIENLQDKRSAGGVITSREQAAAPGPANMHTRRACSCMRRCRLALLRPLSPSYAQLKAQSHVAGTPAALASSRDLHASPQRQFITCSHAFRPPSTIATPISTRDNTSSGWLKAHSRRQPGAWLAHPSLVVSMSVCCSRPCRCK